MFGRTPSTAMLVTVAHKREVGVDIEHVGTDTTVEKIAETALSTPEEQLLSRLDVSRPAPLGKQAIRGAYHVLGGR